MFLPLFQTPSFDICSEWILSMAFWWNIWRSNEPLFCITRPSGYSWQYNLYLYVKKLYKLFILFNTLYKACFFLIYSYHVYYKSSSKLRGNRFTGWKIIHCAWWNVWSRKFFPITQEFSPQLVRRFSISSVLNIAKCSTIFISKFRSYINW